MENKCYCLEKCMFATMKENNGQRDLTQMSAPVIQIDKKNKRTNKNILWRSKRSRKNIKNKSISYLCLLFILLFKL